MTSYFLPKLSSIKLFLMYHKACRLLVRHDGYIRDLQAFRLVLLHIVQHQPHPLVEQPQYQRRQI